jgi:hypothetical protein
MLMRLLEEDQNGAYLLNFCGSQQLGSPKGPEKKGKKPKRKEILAKHLDFV